MKIKEITESFKVTQNNPSSGIELTAADGTKMIIPPEKAAAFQANPTDPTKFVMNTQAMTPTSEKPAEPTGPKIGSEVDIPMATTETQEEDEFADTMDATNRPIGGDSTDDYIDDVVDHKWEKFARHNSPSELGDIKKLSGL